MIEGDYGRWASQGQTKAPTCWAGVSLRQVPESSRNEFLRSLTPGPLWIEEKSKAYLATIGKQAACPFLAVSARASVNFECPKEGQTMSRKSTEQSRERDKQFREHEAEVLRLSHKLIDL